MPKSQQKESQNRIDSIIALILEEARSMREVSIRVATCVVLNKIRARVMKIMRTME